MCVLVVGGGGVDSVQTADKTRIKERENIELRSTTKTQAWSLSYLHQASELFLMMVQKHNII